MINNRFSRWIFESYQPTTEGLALYRILVSLMIIFFLLPDPAYYSYLAEFPDDFYSPLPGPMMLFNEFPPALFLQGVHGMLVLSWISVLVGYKTKYSSLISAGLTLILLGFIFSIGKANHQLVIVLTPAIMAFSNWGGAYSIDAVYRQKKQKAEGWPLVLLALIIGFMFFTAGFPKILGGWLDPDSLATRGHLLNQFFVRGRTELLSGWAVDVQSPLLWGILDWATVIFEVGFLAAVYRAGWTRLFVCLAVLFHLSTMLTLNIAFLINFPAYAAFLPWDSIHNSLSRQVQNNQSATSTGRIPWFFGVTLFLIFILIKVIDKTAWLLPLKEPSFNDVALIGVAVCIVAFFAVRKGLTLVRGLGS